MSHAGDPGGASTQPCAVNWPAGHASPVTRSPQCGRVVRANGDRSLSLERLTLEALSTPIPGRSGLRRPLALAGRGIRRHGRLAAARRPTPPRSAVDFMRQTTANPPQANSSVAATAGQTAPSTGRLLPSAVPQPCRPGRRGHRDRWPAAEERASGAASFRFRHRCGSGEDDSFRSRASDMVCRSFLAGGSRPPRIAAGRCWRKCRPADPISSKVRSAINVSNHNLAVGQRQFGQQLRRQGRRLFSLARSARTIAGRRSLRAPGAIARPASG